MVKYSVFDYSDKDSVKKFYNFYQEFLLSGYMFEEVGSYHNFIKALRENKFYDAIMVYDENVLGGIVFEYVRDFNVGTIHFLETNGDSYLGQMLYDLAVYRLKNIARDFYYERPAIIQGTPKKKQKQHVEDIVHKDEYFLKKLVIPSIDKKFKNK